MIGQVVRYYGCREAVVTDVIVEIPRESTGELEQDLAMKSKQIPHVHVVYEVRAPKGENSVFFGVTDSHVTIGTAVKNC